MTDDDKLSAGVHAKLFSLKYQEQQALAATTSNQHQISELQRAIYINPHGDKAATFQIELDRRLQAPHQSRHKALADLNAMIEHFLDTLPPDVTIDDAKAVKIKLKPGETHQQAVARIREEIAKLIADRDNVQKAGLPTDEIKRQARKWIADRAMKGRPTITAHASRFDVQFTTMVSDGFTAVPDALALLAWFDPKLLETKLNELIDQRPKPALALTAMEKTERLASIASQLLDLERLEIAHIDAAQDEGTIIAHRPNVDIGALLGIVVVREKANAA